MSDYRIQGATGEWEVVIGLEVHAQVTSPSKLFSGASTTFGAEPNAQVSLVDAAMPGMLPVPEPRMHPPGGAHRHGDRRADQPMDRVSTARTTSTPICRRATRSASSITRSWAKGTIDVALDEKDPEGTQTSASAIERIHVEQDAGKLMHDQHPTMSYVDLNRSGVALMEIVSPARHALARRGRGLRPQVAQRSCAMSARATAIWKKARCAPT